MEHITTIATGASLALFTAILAWIGKGRFDALERRIDAHEQSNERRFDQLASEIAQLRSDLLQVVLALTPKHQTG